MFQYFCWHLSFETKKKKEMALCGTQSKGEMLLFKIGFGLRDGGMIVKLLRVKCHLS